MQLQFFFRLKKIKNWISRILPLTVIVYRAWNVNDAAKKIQTIAGLFKRVKIYCDFFAYLCLTMSVMYIYCWMSLCFCSHFFAMSFFNWPVLIAIGILKWKRKIFEWNLHHFGACCSIQFRNISVFTTVCNSHEFLIWSKQR